MRQSPLKRQQVETALGRLYDRERPARHDEDFASICTISIDIMMIFYNVTGRTLGIYSVSQREVIFETDDLPFFSMSRHDVQFYTPNEKQHKYQFGTDGVPAGQGRARLLEYIEEQASEHFRATP